MNIVVFLEGKSLFCNDYKEMFLKLTEEELVIEKVENEFLNLIDNKGNKIQASFFETILPNIETFFSQVSEHRQLMRDNIELFKRQKIDVPKESLKKLANDFAFLPKV